MVCLALRSAFPVHDFCPEIGSMNTTIFTAQFSIIREISELFPTKFTSKPSSAVSSCVYAHQLGGEGKLNGGKASIFEDMLRAEQRWKECIWKQSHQWSWGLSAVALCLFISMRSPSRLGNTHWSPRRSALLTANLLKSIYGITHLTCADCLGQSAVMIQMTDAHIASLIFSQHCNPARVSCNWNSAASAHEMKQEQKVAIFCFEAAFERSARITNETTQWYVLSASSVEGSPPSCWKSKSSPATLHLPDR